MCDVWRSDTDRGGQLPGAAAAAVLLSVCVFVVAGGWLFWWWLRPLVFSVVRVQRRSEGAAVMSSNQKNGSTTRIGVKEHTRVSVYKLHVTIV